MFRANFNLAALAGCFGFVSPFYTGYWLPESPPARTTKKPPRESDLALEKKRAVAEAVRVLGEQRRRG